MLKAMMMTAGVLLAGCASVPEAAPSNPAITIEAGGYADAFDRAKEALRDTGFTLDRVDARAGLITTEPRASVGYTTPWVGHHANAGEAWLGFANREQRVAEIRFMPADGAPIDDLRSYEHQIAAEVVVIVERIEQPGRRIDASGVDFTHRSPGSVYGVGINPASSRSRSRHDPALILLILQKFYKS